MKKIFKITAISVLLMNLLPLTFASNRKIEQVFSYDMIGVDVAYLENIIGIARQTDTHFKTKRYIVDGCHLEAGYQDQSVVTLSVDLTDQCRFNLKDIIPFNEIISSDKLVFGMTGPITYYADCLMWCGNAFDPAVYGLYQGSRAENFRELLLSSISDSYEARSTWRDVMIAKEGEDWVLENRYNCEPQKYNTIAANALKGERVDHVMIGYNLESKRQLQFGCDEPQQQLNSGSAQTAPAVNGIEIIPFQLAYSEPDYRYLLGSAVLDGEIIYEPNEMYGYRFEFKPNEKSSEYLGLDNDMTFVLNDYDAMSETQVIEAMYYLDIPEDLSNPKFEAEYCGIRGKGTLQIIGISLYTPSESEPHFGMRSLKKIETGSFKKHCGLFG